MSINLSRNFIHKIPKIHKRSFSCQYKPRHFFRFGYIGTFLIGSMFFKGLRNDHILILRSIEDIRKELNDINNKKE